MEYATEIIVKKVRKYIVEKRDKEYDEEDIEIYHYQYEELYKDSECDCITLRFKSNDINLILKTTSFGCLEGIVKCHYPQIMKERRADFSIQYKKYCIDSTICSFNGYTSRHIEEDCISLEEQLEIIRNDKGLSPYWDYSPKDVPILERYKDEIYNFLSKS